MPIEERNAWGQGWVYIQTRHPERFEQVEPVERIGNAVKLAGRLRSTGKVATQAFLIPLDEARIVFDGNRKAVAVVSRAVYELLFEIRRSYKIPMRIRMV